MVNDLSTVNVDVTYGRKYLSGDIFAILEEFFETLPSALIMLQKGFCSMDLKNCRETDGDPTGLYDRAPVIEHSMADDSEIINGDIAPYRHRRQANTELIVREENALILAQPDKASKRQAEHSPKILYEWQPRVGLAVCSKSNDENPIIANTLVLENDKCSPTIMENWFSSRKGDQQETVAKRSFSISPQRRWIINQVLVAISVSTGSFLVGFTSAFTSPALESMKDQESSIKVSKSQEAWIGSLMPFSAIIGALLSGVSIDKLGRRITVSGTALPFLVSYILIAAATHVYTIYLARVIAGVAVGMLSSVMPVYLGETVHARVRGTLGLFPTTIGNSGILLCFLFGSYLNWNCLALSAIIFPILFATLMWFTPESPHWYIAKGRDLEAQSSLQWLRGGNKITAELAQQTTQELIDLKAYVNNTKCQQISATALLKRKNLRPLIISLTLMYFQQLSGINAVIFYSNSIFKASGSSIDSNLSSVVIAIVNLVATLLANFLIDRVGRKKLLYVSSVTMAINLIFIGGYFYLQSLGPGHTKTVISLSFVPLMSLILFTLAFSLGWGPIPWLFLGEGLPSQTRGMIGSIAATFNWACAFAVTQSFNSLVDLLGTHVVFWIFSANVIVSALVVYFCLPETKGRTLEDIEYHMQQNSSRVTVTDDPESVVF